MSTATTTVPAHWPRWQRLRRLSPTQRCAAAALVLLGLFAVAGAWVWPDPAAQDLSRFLEPPSLAEPLGRDHLGRSVAGRLASATRLSLATAVACVATAVVAGALAGVLAAWRGGIVDTVLHGLSEAFVALPALLVVLLVSAMSGGGLWTLYAGLALAQWVEYFRVVRARSALVLSGPAVEAAGLLQLGPLHVLRRHLWPDLRPLLTTMATFGVGTSVLALSTLGFVGVGIAPPTPELGLMITEAFPYYDEAPWMSLAPALVLATVLVGLLGLRGKESVS
ncbi:peptide/nickel transport system permease protein [Micromonospora pattaloongensis]|uniref:Peptide/nickel transport system permease protein n=1 Tax=Micromonospora pattaloongensis TaxID=405436 RepID=A0A1H3JT99_9ACTN|nr:ABC transporter permease subunit [Micromonospora pattaloongensis]SDY42755.1 peptide/nickel transport system permease protein [Micromonospora pattaloongensis]